MFVTDNMSASLQWKRASEAERNTNVQFVEEKSTRKLNVTVKECFGRETVIVMEINTVKGGLLFFSGIKENVPFE